MDESLYSGINSQSFTKIKEKKDERKKEQSVKRNNLLPAGEMLGNEFEKAIASVSMIEYVKIDKLTNDFEIKAELMAQKRTVELLKAIQTRMVNVLRDNKEVS